MKEYGSQGMFPACIILFEHSCWLFNIMWLVRILRLQQRVNWGWHFRSEWSATLSTNCLKALAAKKCSEIWSVSDLIVCQIFFQHCLIFNQQDFDSKKKKSHKKKVIYNPDNYGPDDIFCRRCFKPFVSLRGLWSHVTQLRHCRKFYGDDAILEMRESLSALPPVSPSTQVSRVSQIWSALTILKLVWC